MPYQTNIPLTQAEGVINRHESLAANLGAKLTGPRLLKILEKGFEGSITTSPPQSQLPDPISWLDILNFAKSNPEEFVLTTLPNGARVCQFALRGVQVDIIEDDWRLIASGTLDRILPADPLDEDETAEIATVEILEGRLQPLIQKAEELAARARKLSYQLHGRRSVINARLGAAPATGSASRFQAVNNPPRPANINYDLHADLLAQFNSPSPHPRLPSDLMTTPTGTLVPINTIVRSVPAPRGSTPGSRLLWTPGPPSSSRETSDDAGAANRPLITAMVEKLGKGDAINPPCDRCRRLKQDCIKHLTACQGCTRKHAKCTWKSATEDELACLKKDVGGPQSDEPIADGDPDVDVQSQSYSVGRNPSHDEGRGGADETGSGATGFEDRSRPGSRSDHGPHRSTCQGKEDESTLRMEVDPIATEPSETPRRSLPTGLPRDVNLMGVSNASAHHGHSQHPP